MTPAERPGTARGRGGRGGGGAGGGRGHRRSPGGQHFLTDQSLLGRIVDALEAAPGDVVLEIGAGTGTLTQALVERGFRVVAIERARALAQATRERLATKPGEGGGGGALIVDGDALELDWHALVGVDRGVGTLPSASAFAVIGNIPYQITSPLIEKALTPPVPRRIVFLVQAEVADRLAAEPGSKRYGALSVGVQALCRVERLFTVRAGAFRPPPKVTSALVRLTPLAVPLVRAHELEAFRSFVTACFSRRRKQLVNVVAGVTGHPAVAVGVRLRALRLDPRARPETLAPEAFVRLLRGSTAL